jgi:hypothetical protein
MTGLSQNQLLSMILPKIQSGEGKTMEGLCPKIRKFDLFMSFFGVLLSLGPKGTI